MIKASVFMKNGIWPICASSSVGWEQVSGGVSIINPVNIV